MFPQLIGMLLGEAVKQKLRGQDPSPKQATEVKARSKGMLTSKTIIGIIVMLLGWASTKYGFGLGDAAIMDIAQQVMVIGGGVFAIYGRVVSKKKIG